jgi:hypothetical protein
MPLSLIIYLFLFLFPHQVWAQSPPPSMRSSTLPTADNASSYLDDFNSAITGLTYDLSTTPGKIITDLLPIIFSLAGLILFGMLIAGGFQMMTSAGNPKGADAGKARLTSALIGFLIIFIAYWLTQIMQIIFGIKIL